MHSLNAVSLFLLLSLSSSLFLVAVWAIQSLPATDAALCACACACMPRYSHDSRAAVRSWFRHCWLHPSPIYWLLTLCNDRIRPSAFSFLSFRCLSMLPLLATTLQRLYA
jgi:hypothetical protein